MSLTEKQKEEMETLLMFSAMSCRKCKNTRTEVCECCLPKEMKEQLDEAGMKGRYLYCPNCNEYSVICEPEFG